MSSAMEVNSSKVSSAGSSGTKMLENSTKIFQNSSARTLKEPGDSNVQRTALCAVTRASKKRTTA